MRVSINYSPPAAELADAGEIQVDVFKCPAWPDLLDNLSDRDVYVHFPLLIGTDDAVINSEQNAPADFAALAKMRDQTGTPFINTHFVPRIANYPDIPVDSLQPEHVERIMARCVDSVRQLQAYFGVEAVIVENVPDANNTTMHAALMPENITRLVEETGCGFLLDISHARIAANSLGMDARAYINALPVDHIREIHVTGIIRMDENVIAAIEAMGIAEGFYHKYIGKLVDHVPFTDDDWPFLSWAFGQIHSGEWRAPEIVAFEYGGVGGMWEKIADKATIRQQVPRLYDLVKGAVPIV